LNKPAIIGGEMATLRSVTGADPAAGSEITDAVAAGKYWKILSVEFSLVTAVAVANRTVQVVIDDGTLELFRSPALTIQTASLTWIYSVTSIPSQAQANAVVLISIPLGLLLGTGYRFRTVTTNIQGADNYGAPQYQVWEYDTSQDSIATVEG
jgi:hypothetical protein